MVPNPPKQKPAAAKNKNNGPVIVKTARCLTLTHTPGGGASEQASLALSELRTSPFSH